MVATAARLTKHVLTDLPARQSTHSTKACSRDCFAYPLLGQGQPKSWVASRATSRGATDNRESRCSSRRRSRNTSAARRSERCAPDAWATDGVTVADGVPDLATNRVGLLLLEKSTDGVAGASYWIALKNLYVFTRHNRSRL